MKEGGVTVISGTPVTKITAESGHLSYVTLANDQRIYARSYIFATGGLSHPETGSTGDGFGWLRDLGHTIVKPDPSLVPLTLKDSWVTSAAGVSLADCKLSILEGEKKIHTQTGGLLFTHQGISGPATLNISRDVADRLPYRPVELALDLLPKESLETIDALLQKTIGEFPNRKIRNLVSTVAPTALTGVILERAGIDGETAGNSVTREQRIALGKVLKSFTLTVKGRLGFEKAIIASGGVSLDEIDTRTMQSRVIDNLYIVGDLLHIDRPSGGYSLQLCWTTGAVAGLSAVLTAET